MSKEIKKCADCHYAFPNLLHFIIGSMWDYALCTHSESIKDERSETPNYHLGESEVSKVLRKCSYCSIMRMKSTGNCTPDAIYFKKERRNFVQKMKDMLFSKVRNKNIHYDI